MNYFQNFRLKWLVPVNTLLLTRNSILLAWAIVFAYFTHVAVALPFLFPPLKFLKFELMSFWLLVLIHVVGLFWALVDSVILALVRGLLGGDWVGPLTLLCAYFFLLMFYFTVWHLCACQQSRHQSSATQHKSQVASNNSNQAVIGIGMAVVVLLACTLTGMNYLVFLPLYKIAYHYPTAPLYNWPIATMIFLFNIIQYALNYWVFMQVQHRLRSRLIGEGYIST